MSNASDRHPRLGPWRLPFSLLALAVVPVAALLEARLPGTYFVVVQEDGIVEWATFWSFLAASLVSFGATRHAPTRWFIVYATGLGLGCLLIALEEISWGQRVVGFRPPELFLSENAQQELNLHNLIVTDARKAALITLLLGFGVMFPAAARFAPLRGWLLKWSVPAPSLPIVPVFLAATALYLTYPWQSTGEWVELLAGLGFFYAALELHPRSATFTLPHATAAWCTPLLLGWVTWLLPSTHDASERIEWAGREAHALAADVRDGRLRSRCGVHKRLFTFVSEYGAIRFDEGEFANLPDLDSTRREYFLDPWNLAYWIRHECTGDRQERIVFIYSFGPDGRRDSTEDAIAGDDVGHYVYED